MTIIHLKKSVEDLNYVSHQGFNFNKPENNLSTFPYCCAMFYSDFYTGVNKLGDKIFREQWCIRTDNYSKSGLSNKHLTFFNMGGLFNFSPKDYISDVGNVLETVSNLVDSNNIYLVASEKLEDDLLNFLNDSFKLSLKQDLDWKVNFKTPLEGNRIEVFYQKDDFKMELWNMSLLFSNGGYSLFDSGGSLERLSSASEKSSSVFENCYFDIHRSTFNSDLSLLFPSKHRINYFLDISRTISKLSDEHYKNNLSKKQQYHLRQLSTDLLSFLKFQNVELADLHIVDLNLTRFLQKRELFFDNKFSIYEDSLLRDRKIRKDQIPLQVKELVHKKNDLPIDMGVFPNILSLNSEEKDL